jgi:hypothetical protein
MEGDVEINFWDGSDYEPELIITAQGVIDRDDCLWTVFFNVHCMAPKLVGARIKFYATPQLDPYRLILIDDADPELVEQVKTNMSAHPSLRNGRLGSEG